MTIDAATNPDNGSVSDQPSSDINDPANLNFADESDEEQTNETETGAEVEAEPDAGTEPQESDESESVEASDDTETEAEDESAPVEVNVPEDALVTLPNGEKVKFADLKKAPMFEKDYRQKTQQLGTERRALAEQAGRINSVLEGFANYLVQQLPAEPSLHLAATDPQEFVRQKALYDASINQVQQIIAQATAAKGESDQLSEAEFAAARKAAAEAVAEKLPFLSNPQKAQQFDKDIAEAASFFGYSQQEVSKMTDPRLFHLAYYAHKGMKAEQAEKKVKAKVQAAPQATPAKKAAAKSNPDFLKNKEAMRRLAKSGSIHDALSIDFD